ncbi:AB-hydrolase YheT [Fomitopsis serialis]|uniref:AB-hydrolase YheT n=1 Tax=Fomitopsis serialis TaxID=139415 RepID=UPI0020075D27|nr:AB-hydrolase YheT [Neoantrodia serialis]KAH9934794.1 AB-hydrolase YheT [Neoantrodia serialis]
MGALVSQVWAARSSRVPRLYFAVDPAKVSVKAPAVTGSDADEQPKESLDAFIAARCPSLYGDFSPPWWLFNGHLQTAYAVMGDFSKIDRVEYDRSLLRTLDGGTIGLDSTPPANERTLPDDTPIVVALHGLTGGSHESYVRAILAPACTPVEQGGLGYRGIVVNFRGCAGVPLTTPQMYSAGHTDDIRVAVMHIANRYPKARLLGIGFSLGANVLTRYLAEEGTQSRLAAGCVVACPWDCSKNAAGLEHQWLHRTVYGKAMAQNLRRLLGRHANEIAKFPEHPLAKTLPEVLSNKPMSLTQFDAIVTRVVGGSSPPFPFPSAWDYYVWASSHEVLPNIRVPFLALNAEDDPVVQVLPVEAGGNPYVVFAVTEKGGHLGWFETVQSTGEVRRWVSRPIVQWLRAVGEDLVVGDRQVGSLHVVDGFLKEVGRDDIGCKEVESGGHVVGVEGEAGLFAGL